MDFKPRSKSHIGLVGVGVMGSNLAENIIEKGFRLNVYDRNAELREQFTNRNLADCEAFDTLEALVTSLESPRCIMVMIKSGDPVDWAIGQLLPLLAPNDIIVDLGNSHYRDTERRVATVAEAGMLYLGTGVSGGAEGARHGPSIMPGGHAAAWTYTQEFFESIAAQFKGQPCVTWIGNGGAGHFVKMTHNGIEYADMQLIAETYQLMRFGLGLDLSDISAYFERWNNASLRSFLLEISANILKVTDADGTPVVDNILDRAGQKGTGSWSTHAALDYGVPTTLITESVLARVVSSFKAERTRIADISKPQAINSPYTTAEILADLESAMYAAKLIAYVQGYELMQAASDENDWSLDLIAISKIWRAGCIIRGSLLDELIPVLEQDKGNETGLLGGTIITALLGEREHALRRVVVHGMSGGIALPCLSAALTYLDSIRSATLPANMIQAQRDYFGAHGFQKIGDDSGKLHYFDWG